MRKQLNLSQIRYLIHSCYKSKKKRIKFQLTPLTSSIKQESLERWREFCNPKFKCIALTKLIRPLLGMLEVPSSPRAHLQRQVAQQEDYSCVSWGGLNRNEQKKWTCKHTNVKWFLLLYKFCFPKWEVIRTETVVSKCHRRDDGTHLFIWRLREFARSARS